MSDLSNCPFCGGRNVSIERDCMEENGWEFMAGCDTCGANAPSGVSRTWVNGNPDRSEESAKREAADKWNTRPSLWIDVEERLPEEFEHVLLWTFEGASEGWLSEGQYLAWHNQVSPVQVLGVTHWQPLQKGP